MRDIRMWDSGCRGMLEELGLGLGGQIGEERERKIGHLVGFLCAKLDVGGVHVAITYSTHFHREGFLGLGFGTYHSVKVK